MSDEQLVELEREFWRRGGDADFYRSACTDDVVMAFPAPFGIAGRDAVIAAVADGTNWSEFELDEVRVTRPAPGTAVVVYRASARRGESAYRCYAGSVHVERDGSWKLAFHQQTPIAD